MREREREREDQIRIENMNGAVTSEAVSVTTLECQLSIGVVRPANTPQCWRDELCLESFSKPSAALQSPLSQSHPATFLVRPGFYSQLNISTENLIRICKTLGRVENVIIRYRVMVVSLVMMRRFNYCLFTIILSQTCGYPIDSILETVGWQKYIPIWYMINTANDNNLNLTICLSFLYLHNYKAS